MLDKILTCFKTEFGSGHFSSMITSLEDLIAHFESDFVVDGNARNAAIDTLIQFLQSQKK